MDVEYIPNQTLDASGENIRNCGEVGRDYGSKSEDEESEDDGEDASSELSDGGDLRVCPSLPSFFFFSLHSDSVQTTGRPELSS